ncbi:hypothetical protein N2152v2_003500 [Parachlorella kessleri]
MEKPQGLDEEDGKFSYCLACRNKLNSSLGKRVVVCDRCPAAFHAQCAGYASVKAIPEGEWLCWACSKDGNKFLFPTSKYQGRVGEPVRIGYVEPNSNSRCFVTFYEATVEAVTEKDLRTTETLPRNSPSIWRGTLQKEAWVVEKDAHWEHWQPRSRGDKWPVVSAAKRYLASRRKSHLDQEQPLPSQQQKQQEEEQSLHQEQQQQQHQQQEEEEAEEPSQQRKRKEREHNRQGPAQQPETHGPSQAGVVQGQQQQKQPEKSEVRQAVGGGKQLPNRTPTARQEADKAGPPSQRARPADKPQQHLHLPNGAETGPCVTGGGPIASGSPASQHGSPLGSRHGRRPRGSGKHGKSPCPEPSGRPAAILPAGEGSLPRPKAATECSPHTTPADSAKQAAVSHLRAATADKLKGAVSIPPRAAARATAAAACGPMIGSASSPTAPTSNAALTVADANAVAGAAPAITQGAVAHCKASVGGEASKRTVQKVAGVDRNPVGEAELAASQQVSSPTRGATAGDSGRAAALLAPGEGLVAEVRPTSTAAAVGAGATAIQQPPPCDAAPPQPSTATAVSSELAKEANKASNEMRVLRKIRPGAASSLKRERPEEQAHSGQLSAKRREVSEASGEALSEKGKGTGWGGSSERSARCARTESQAGSAATAPAAASPAGAGVEAKVQGGKASAASGRGATDVSKPRLAGRAAELQAAGAGQPGLEAPGAGRGCLIAWAAPSDDGAGASAGTSAAVSQDAAAAPGSLAQEAGRGGFEAELPAGGRAQPAKDKRAGRPAEEHEGDQPGKAEREGQPAKATEHGAAAGGEAPASSKCPGSTGRGAAVDGPQPASAAGDPAAAGAMAPVPLPSPAPSSLEQAKCKDMPPKRRKLSGKGAVLSPAPGSAKAARGAGDTAAGQGAQGAAGSAAGDGSAAELARQHWRVAGGGAARARATPLQLLKRMARGKLKLATTTVELPVPGSKARPAYEVVGEFVSTICIDRQRVLQQGSPDVAVAPAGSSPAAAATYAGAAVRAGGVEQGPGPALQPQAERGGADPHAAPAEGPQEPAAPPVLAPAQTHRPPVALAPAVEASWKSLAAAPAAAAGPCPPSQQPEPAAPPVRPLGQQKEQDNNLAGTGPAALAGQPQHQPRQQLQPTAAASQPHPHQRPLQHQQQQQQQRPAAAIVQPGQPTAQQQQEQQWPLPGALPMHPLPASAALGQQWAAGAKTLPQHVHVAHLPGGAAGPLAAAAAAALAAPQAGGGASRLARAGLAARNTAPKLVPSMPLAVVSAQQAAARPTAVANQSAIAAQHTVPWPPAAPPGVLLIRSTAVSPWQQAGGQAPVLQGRVMSGQPLQAAHHPAAAGAGTVPAAAGAGTVPAAAGGGGTGLAPAARAGVPAVAAALGSASSGVPRVPPSAAMLPAGRLASLADSGVPVSGYTQQSMTPEQAAWVQRALAAQQAAAVQQAMAAMVQPSSAQQAAVAAQQAVVAEQAGAATSQASSALRVLAAQRAVAVQHASAAQQAAVALAQPSSAQQAGAAQEAAAAAAQQVTPKQQELASLKWHQQPQWLKQMQNALHQQQQHQLQHLKAWQQQHVATRLAMQPASAALAQQHTMAVHAGGVGWPLQVASGPVVITAPQVRASCAAAGANPRPAGAAAAGMRAAGATIAPPAGTPAATAAAAAVPGAVAAASASGVSATCAVAGGFARQPAGLTRDDPPQGRESSLCADRAPTVPSLSEPASAPVAAPAGTLATPLVAPAAPAAALEEAAAISAAPAHLRGPTLGSASLQAGGAGGGDAGSDTLEEGEILDDPAPLRGASAAGPGLSAGATAPAAVASPTPPAGLAAPTAPDGSSPATCNAAPSAPNGSAPATSTAAAHGWVAGPAPVQGPPPEAPFRPGDAVEAMPRDRLGRWYEGRVLQVELGTPEEGGWRLLVHFPAGSPLTTAATSSGASQEWVPLVSHQEAGGGGSSPILRVRPKLVPLLAGGHKCVVVGQEVEVPALHAWWPAVVRSISESTVEVEYLQAPPAIAGSGRRWWPVSIHHVRKPPQPPPYAAQLMSRGQPAATPSLPAAATAADDTQSTAHAATAAADDTQSTAHAARQPVGVALEEEALAASAGATAVGGAAAASARDGRPASLAVAAVLGGDPPRPAHGGGQWPAQYEQAQREQGHQAQHDEEAQQQHAPVVLQHGNQTVDGATDAPLLLCAPVVSDSRAHLLHLLPPAQGTPRLCRLLRQALTPHEPQLGSLLSPEQQRQGGGLLPEGARVLTADEEASLLDALPPAQGTPRLCQLLLRALTPKVS